MTLKFPALVRNFLSILVVSWSNRLCLLALGPSLAIIGPFGSSGRGDLNRTLDAKYEENQPTRPELLPPLGRVAQNGGGGKESPITTVTFSRCQPRQNRLRTRRVSTVGDTAGVPTKSITDRSAPGKQRSEAVTRSAGVAGTESTTAVSAWEKKS